MKETIFGGKKLFEEYFEVYFEVSSLAQVITKIMDEKGFKTYTAANHQRVFKML